MAASSLMDTFQEYVAIFNQSIKDENIADAVRIGRKLVQIADDECRRPEVNAIIKKNYVENSQRARELLADMSMNNAGGRVTVVKQPATEKRKWFSDEVPDYTLRDVKGLEDVKSEFVVNILAPLSQKYSPIYKKYRGSKFSAQILLYGPPGTGKTFLVKCLAGTLKCHIAVVQCKDIYAGLWGEAENSMNDVFEEAALYDNCIIFLDEIDTLASSREDEDSRHTKGVLSTMLTNMDGFTSKVKEGQQRIIIAATNRPWILDSAIKRGGRFDMQIYVPLPDYEARYQLVRLALGKDEDILDRVDVPCAETVSSAWLAEMLDGMSGADIQAVCRQIINRPLQREILALMYDNEVRNEVVTREDCSFIIGKYINGVTDEMLTMFDAYSSGLEFIDYIKIISRKAAQSRDDIPEHVLRYIDRFNN